MRNTLSLILRALLFIALASSLAATEQVIPSSQCRGLFIVPVTWNGVTLDLILDTGASFTAIDPDSIERVKGKRLKSGKKTTLKKGGAGPLEIRRVRARVHEMDHLSLALGQPIDGILGYDTFHDLLLTLDYHAGEVRIAKGSLPPPDNVRIFKDYGKVRPYIRVELNGDAVPVLIDSGFAGSIDLHPDDHLEWETTPKPVSAAVRYSEVVIQSSGRVNHDIVFGPLTLVRPIVRVSQGTRIAGAKLLDRFVLTFDHRNKRIRMLPDKDEPEHYDSIQSWGIATRPRVSGFEVIEVFPETSAADAGVRRGDILLAVDGEPIHQRGCKSIYEPDSPDPSTLTMQREGVEFDVELEATVLVP